MDPFMDEVRRKLSDPRFYAQIGLIVVTYPIWIKLVRAMWQEFNESLAPEGGVFGNERPRPVRRRSPGVDPFFNIPMPSHRVAMERRARDQRRRPGRAAEGRSAGAGSEERVPSARGGFSGARKKAGF